MQATEDKSDKRTSSTRDRLQAPRASSAVPAIVKRTKHWWLCSAVECTFNRPLSMGGHWKCEDFPGMGPWGVPRAHQGRSFATAHSGSIEARSLLGHEPNEGSSSLAVQFQGVVACACAGVVCAWAESCIFSWAEEGKYTSTQRWLGRVPT